MPTQLLDLGSRAGSGGGGEGGGVVFFLLVVFLFFFRFVVLWFSLDRTIFKFFCIYAVRCWNFIYRFDLICFGV